MIQNRESAYVGSRFFTGTGIQTGATSMQFDIDISYWDCYNYLSPLWKNHSESRWMIFTAVSGKKEEFKHLPLSASIWKTSNHETAKNQDAGIYLRPDFIFQRSRQLSLARRRSL